MTQDERLARNIRSLRKVYGETQEDLAFAVGYEAKQAISKIEHNKGKVTKDILDKIAKHYMVTTEELLNDDFSGLPRVNPDINRMRTSYQVVFPIVCTDKAMKDTAFCKGVEAHKALYKCLSATTPDVNQFDELSDIAIEAYCEVGEDAKEDAAANLLALLMLLINPIDSGMEMMKAIDVGPEMMKAGTAPIEKLCNSDTKFKSAVKEFRRQVDDNPSGEKERQFDVRELKNGELGKGIMELIKGLKQSPQFGYLADYYLALRFFYNIVPNGLEASFNRRIGSELLSALEELGNPAAIRFSRLTTECWRPENA